FKPDTPVHPTSVPNLIQTANVRVREDIAYANHKGEPKSGQRKNADKLIGNLQVPIARFLDADEVVLYVARVQAPVNFLDQWTWGWYIYYVTATVLVFTNKRILHLRVDSSNKWTRGAKTCSWADVNKAEIKGFLFSKRLKLTFHGGSAISYWKLRNA